MTTTPDEPLSPFYVERILVAGETATERGACRTQMDGQVRSTRAPDRNTLPLGVYLQVPGGSAVGTGLFAVNVQLYASVYMNFVKTANSQNLADALGHAPGALADRGFKFWWTSRPMLGASLEEPGRVYGFDMTDGAIVRSVTVLDEPGFPFATTVEPAPPKTSAQLWRDALGRVVERRGRRLIPGVKVVASEEGAWTEVDVRFGYDFLQRWSGLPLNSIQQATAAQLVEKLTATAALYDAAGGVPLDIESDAHRAWRAQMTDLANQIGRLDGGAPPAPTTQAVTLRLLDSRKRLDLSPGVLEALRALLIPHEPQQYVAEFYRGRGGSSVAFHAAIDALDAFLRSV